MIKLPIKPSKKPVYLDHAATTPMDPKVFAAMKPFFMEKFGNPSSLYQKGIEAKAALEEARAKIGFLLGASGHEIIFTSGGSESINMALQGVARAHKMKGTIITQATEHHAVLRCLEYLATQGLDVIQLPVDHNGLVRPEDLAKTLTADTILVSIMYANNEIGTIQPLKELVEVVRAFEARTRTQIYFHTDACQAAQYLPLNVEDLNIDLLSFNGSKIYGPKASGALYLRRGKHGVALDPLIFGGNQERALRSGTEAVSEHVGLATALTLVRKNLKKESHRLTKLRDFFTKELLKIPGTHLNGDVKNRLPNNINICIDGIDGEAAVLHLDEYNIQCSTGSACTSTETAASHVLMALGQTEQQANSSLRFTLGHTTTKQQLIYTLKVLRVLVDRLRQKI